MPCSVAPAANGGVAAPWGPRPWILAGLSPLLAIFMTHPAAALAVLASGVTLAGLAGPATWAATMDLGGKSSTSVMAVLNMSGNVGAFLCPVAVGTILDAFPERWSLVLLMFSMVYITGGIMLAADGYRQAGSLITIDSRWFSRKDLSK